MFRLGFPERARRTDLTHDLARPESRGIDVGDHVFGNLTLIIVDIEDRRSITRADVVALSIHRGRVVNLEEEREDVAV